MTQHTGPHVIWQGEWRLQLEIDDEYSELQYRYMILSEREVEGPGEATPTEPVRTLKLSGGDIFDCHADGDPIHVKDAPRPGMESLPFGPTPNIPHPHHSASLINSRIGRARFHGSEFTPQRSWH